MSVLLIALLTIYAPCSEWVKIVEKVDAMTPKDKMEWDWYLRNTSYKDWMDFNAAMAYVKEVKARGKEVELYQAGFFCQGVKERDEGKLRL